MIHRLSLEIADYLFYRKIISFDKYEIYRYGLEMIVSTIIGIILVISCGILTNSFIHAIIFYILFVTLRMYTGGYHADSHLACKLVLCSSFLITYYIFKVILSFFNLNVYFLLSLFNLITVTFLSPIECEKKPLSESTKNKNRIISISLYLTIIFVLLVLYLMSYREWTLFSILVATNVSMLMYIGYIKERRSKDEVR